MGLKRRHAEKLRRLRDGEIGSRKPVVGEQHRPPAPAPVRSVVSSSLSTGRLPAEPIMAGAATAGRASAGQHLASQTSVGPAAVGPASVESAWVGSAVSLQAAGVSGASGQAPGVTVAAQFNVAESDAVKLGVVESGVVESGVVESGVVESGVVEPGLAEPHVAELAAVESGAVEAGAVEPGVVERSKWSKGEPVRGSDSGASSGCGDQAGPSAAMGSDRFAEPGPGRAGGGERVSRGVRRRATNVISPGSRVRFGFPQRIIFAAERCNSSRGTHRWREFLSSENRKRGGGPMCGRSSARPKCGPARIFIGMPDASSRAEAEPTEVSVCCSRPGSVLGGGWLR